MKSSDGEAPASTEPSPQQLAGQTIEGEAKKEKTP
jgi:hypothetical protein